MYSVYIDFQFLRRNVAGSPKCWNIWSNYLNDAQEIFCDEAPDTINGDRIIKTFFLSKCFNSHKLRQVNDFNRLNVTTIESLSMCRDANKVFQISCTGNNIDLRNVEDCQCNDFVRCLIRGNQLGTINEE